TRDDVLALGPVNLQRAIAVGLGAKEAENRVGSDVAASEDDILDLFDRGLQFQGFGFARAQRLIGIAQAKMLGVQHRGIDEAENLTEVVTPQYVGLQIGWRRNRHVAAYRGS